MDQLVAVARLGRRVGPFTFRRIFLRYRIFSTDEFSTDEIQLAMPAFDSELKAMLSQSEHAMAMQDLRELLARAIAAEAGQAS